MTLIKRSTRFNSVFFFQFLCIENIRVFLDACHTNFSLNKKDLFEEEELYDATRFYRVLVTLSKLSQCPKAKANRPKIM